jgi:hypothetical protein
MLREYLLCLWVATLDRFGLIPRPQYHIVEGILCSGHFLRLALPVALSISRRAPSLSPPHPHPTLNQSATGYHILTTRSGARADAANQTPEFEVSGGLPLVLPTSPEPFHDGVVSAPTSQDWAFMAYGVDLEG